MTDTPISWLHLIAMSADLPHVTASISTQSYGNSGLIGGIRALNPGSTGLPRPAGRACWLILHDRGYGDLTAEHRTVPYDAGAVAGDLHRRRHPNATYIGAVLTGQREPYPTPSAAR